MANLIDIDEYKTSENIQSTKDDARISLLIAAVSQLVKTYCNATFVDYYTNAKTERVKNNVPKAGDKIYFILIIIMV